MEEGLLKALRRGWCFGSEEFRQRMLERVAGAGRKPAGPILAAHNEGEALRLIAAGLKAVGLAGADLKTLPKGDPRKIAVAAVVKRRTIVGNGALVGDGCGWPGEPVLLRGRRASGDEEADAGERNVKK